MRPDELAWLTAAQAARLLRARQLSPRELVEACLQRLEQENPRLNAFLTVSADEARTEARRAESEMLHQRYRGPLHGIPYALKDLFATRGLRTTAGSKILADWVPDYDSTAGERLRAAGAILLGKTNTHEFAFGATTINPHYGPTRNPWDLERVPGGSSGGSAAAVAAGLCPLALGTDTGGSIRLPAAVTGIVGLKPTYGRISRAGVVPLSWSQDHVGPLTRTVEDAALALNVLAGHDRRDPASARLPVPDYTRLLGQGIKDLRLGLLKEQLDLPTGPAIRQAFDQAVAVLKDLGARVRVVSFPEHEQALAVGSIILFAEAASAHERWLRARPADYGADVRLRLEQGALLSATDYLRAQRARRAVAARFRQLFNEVDAILSPTSPIAAPRLDEPLVALGDRQVDARAALLRNTRLYDVLGLPALSVPCGFTPDGLPVGLQIAARAWDEATALRVGHALEQATPWHRQHPRVQEHP